MSVSSRPIPGLGRRALHLLAGLLPLAWGLWRWQSVLSVHTVLAAGGLFYTLAVLAARGRSVRFLGEFFQAAVTLIFLDLALREVELAELWKALRGLDLLLLAWGMFTFAAGVWFRGYRWYFLLEEKGNLQAREAIFATYISFFGNYALPARAGEILRILVLGRRTGTSRTRATAAVAVEKLSDLLALVGLILYLLVFTNLGGPTLRWLGLVGGLISLVFIALLFTVVYLRRRFPFLEDAGHSPAAQKLRRALHHFVEGLRPAARPAHLGQFLLYSIISWVLIAYSCYAFLDSQGLLDWLAVTSRVGPVPSSLLMVILVNASTLIPAAPGSAGPYQAAVVLSFAILGTGASVAGTTAYHNAAGFSIVYWIGHAVPSLVIGGILFFRSGYSLQLLRSAEKAAIDRTAMSDGGNAVDADRGPDLR